MKISLFTRRRMVKNRVTAHDIDYVLRNCRCEHDDSTFIEHSGPISDGRVVIVRASDSIIMDVSIQERELPHADDLHGH